MYVVTITYSDPVSVKTPITLTGQCFNTGMATSYIAQMMNSLATQYADLKTVTMSLTRT